MVEMNSFEKDFKKDREFPTVAETPSQYLSQNASTQQQQQDQFGSSYPSNTGHPSYHQDNHYGRPQNGKPDLFDSLWQSVNHDLFICKTFYFFFFSAFGSLFPLMGIFFKQLGMNPVQCGLLVGFRPFVEFLSAPFWGTLADRYQKGKQILLSSLVCWIAFTLALCFITPPAASCIYYNKTHYVLVSSEDMQQMEKRSISWIPPPNLDHTTESQWIVRSQDGSEDKVPDSNLSTSTINSDDADFLLSTNRDEQERDDKRNDDEHDDDWSSQSSASNNEMLRKWKFDRLKRLWRTKFPPDHVIGQSPGTVRHTVNYDPQKHSSYVSPIFSTIVYRKEDVQSTFFLILLIVVIGEFFSAPAITLADSVTLTYLGDNANNYGKQRMFGSLGWGLAMFFVGIALDHATIFSYHPCGPHERERNYTICFAVFSVLMGCALISATQFRFDYDAIDDTIPMRYMADGNVGKPNVEQTGVPPDGTVEAIEPPIVEQDTEPKPEKSTVFASKAKQIPEWFRVLRTFANLRYGSFLFVAWFMGLGVGIVFTFLFWHLQDLEGTPTLFGVASVINHISEIFAYFFSFRLIRQIGHVRVLCLGLLGNLGRFLYVSWLTNPWWVLPFEFIQGVTHAAVWAACCSYITQATPMNLRSSAQGVLQGLHLGLGRGCGAVLGGLLATYSGTAVTFRAYGFSCLIVLVAFIFINYYQPEHGFASAESVEPHQVLEESSHLAPHGVPSGSIPRALSSSRLEDLDNDGGNGTFQGYGTTEKRNGPFLDIPKQGGMTSGGGGVNPIGRRGVQLDSEWASIEAELPDDTTSIPPTVWSNDKEDLIRVLWKKKSSPPSSPQPKLDEDFIQENFKAYNEVLNSNGYNEINDDDNNGNVQLLKAPPPLTVLHSLQPVNRRIPSSYDW